MMISCSVERHHWVRVSWSGRPASRPCTWMLAESCASMRLPLFFTISGSIELKRNQRFGSNATAMSFDRSVRVIQERRLAVATPAAVRDGSGRESSMSGNSVACSAFGAAHWARRSARMSRHKYGLLRLAVVDHEARAAHAKGCGPNSPLHHIEKSALKADF